ncbi:germination protein [Sporosarcina sp. NCCP-2716]|uniref:Ger(x)C family spore germination protein n=1 Tax=Sporosarcina sp. NCCP-2716 TaxID=2943679 RepID=UPI00203B7D3B|nr:Ger(x)C family spore germination protein [Sporosarcina sp. NCCP-2716]GKV69811.1 germination protein [Sporosarcina sp. NCCP-2716]
MSRWHKKGLLVVTILLISFLAGCAYKSVDKRSFVVSVGVDPAENDDDRYKVTLKIAKPIASLRQATETEYTYLTTEAETVSEAIRILETHNDKVVDFSQAKILAIHHELLSGDLQLLMDYFTRRGDIQLIMYVAAAKPSAEEVLKVEPILEAAGENTLYNFFDDTGTESPFVTTSFLFEFRRDVLTFGKDAVLPIVRTSKNKDELVINTALVIKENHEPVDLNRTQTKLYNTFMEGANGYGYQAHNSGYIFTLTFDRAKMNYKLGIVPGQTPQADIKVKAVGAISQSNKTLSLNRLPEYSEVTNKELSKEMEKLFKKMQKEKVDPFGFGLRYRATRFHTDQIEEDWNEIYPDLVFNVQSDVKLKSLGAIK